MAMKKSNIFLTAEWRKLAIANYPVDPILLKPFLPHNTELDIWENKCYISLIGFMFLNTRLKSFRIPFHSNFEEVNLRFYVRYKENGFWKRGVTFIKEIVPKLAITFFANTLYNEKYQTLPMSHYWIIDDKYLDIEYKWKNRNWNSIKVKAENVSLPIKINSEEDFITEHYWGYSKINNSQTTEYGVEHPRWNSYKIIDYSIDVDFGEVYGKQFAFLSEVKPYSVMLAEGSEILIRSGNKI